MTVLPALKYFVGLFAERKGSIYEIPERYVKDVGYSDQFHWAVIAEYYDVGTIFFIVLVACARS